MSSRKRKPCFSNRLKGWPCTISAGFTLLEVMIAVALIAIALVTLIGAQAQSVSIATGSRFDAMASLLAQWKLTELSLQGYEQLTGGEGNFGEEYPHFFWKSEVHELAGDETGIKEAKGLLKTLDVTVLVDQDKARTYTVRTILYKKPAATK
jgi:general secretion pathway protein I